MPSRGICRPIIYSMCTGQNLAEHGNDNTKESSIHEFFRVKLFFGWIFFSSLAYVLGAIPHQGYLGLLYFYMIPIALITIIIQGLSLCLFVPNKQHGREKFKKFFSKNSVLYYLFLFNSMFAFSETTYQGKIPNFIYGPAGDLVGLISWPITIGIYLWIMFGVIKIFISSKINYPPSPKEGRVSLKHLVDWPNL